MHKLVVVLALVAASSTVASAAAPSVPRTGVVVPGKSFAGLGLGLTPAQVRARWGSRFGVCDNCVDQTWYYTFQKFKPQAIGVRFQDGRVVAYFTLGKPRGWRTKEGLALGDPTVRVKKLYGTAPVIDCAGYSLYQILIKGKLLIFYLDGGTVYGLGLADARFNPCR